MNNKYLVLGAGLVALAVTPTPDDVTIISPALQLTAGSLLLIAGLVTDEKK